MIRGFATFKEKDFPVISVLVAPEVITILEDNIVEDNILD